MRIWGHDTFRRAGYFHALYMALCRAPKVMGANGVVRHKLRKSQRSNLRRLRFEFNRKFR